MGNHGKYYFIGFDDATGKRYNLEVDVNLVDEERSVMSVFVMKDYDDGNCLVLLPETSFLYNDQVVLPQEKIWEWSPRLSAKQALYGNCWTCGGIAPCKSRKCLAGEVNERD